MLSSKHFSFTSTTNEIEVRITGNPLILKNLKLNIFAVKSDGKFCNFEENNNCGIRNHELAIEKNSNIIGFEKIKVSDIQSQYAVQHDIDFPFSTEGHYFAIIGKGSAYLDTLKPSILTDDFIDPVEKICTITFYAFGSRYSSRLFNLFVETDQKTFLVGDVNLIATWKMYQLSLKKFLGKRYRIIIMSINDDYTNSIIGIDRIEYNRCPEEKLQTELKILETSMSNCEENCIKVLNRDDERHNSVWLENIAFHKSNPRENLININLHSAYILLRNLNIKNLNNSLAMNIIFHSKIKTRISNLILTQSTFINLNQSPILNAINYGINNATTTIEKISIQDTSGVDPIISIENFIMKFMNNYIYNNINNMEIIYVNSSLEVLISDCYFYFNKINTKNRGIIHSDSPRIDMNNNILFNPKTSYYFSTGVSKEKMIYADLIRNFWGNDNIQKVREKIYDGFYDIGLGKVDIYPPLNIPPENIYSTKQCQKHWIYLNGICLFVHFGVDSYENAVKFCSEKSAYLIRESFLNQTPKIIEYMSYRDIDGKTKISSIWTQGNSPSDSNMLRPWICRKSHSGNCPKHCNNKGKCVGATCLCDPGWEGEYCSIFHCREVANCSSSGSCVGPNICSCEDGWEGDNCAKSICSRYLSCSQCTKQIGCGWCDSSAKCLPGESRRAYIPCQDWFYRHCLSFPNHNCSSEIKSLNCNKEACKHPPANKIGECRECEYMEECFDRTVSGCLVVNETKCFFGFPEPKFTDSISKIKHALKGHIKVFPISMKIYRCSTYNHLKEGINKEVEIFLIPTYERTVIEGQIFMSNQAGGIMHKVLKVWRTSAKYLTVLSSPADPMEIFQYIHDKMEIQDRKIYNQRLTQRVLTKEQIELFYDKKNSFKEVKNEEILKCLGKEYLYNGEKVWSFYILIKDDKYKKDDILFIEKVNGYLERVKKFERSSYNIFTETEMVDCSKGLKKNEEDSLDSVIDTKPDMECKTGDGTKGLVYSTIENFSGNLTKNNLIIGRSAPSTIGIVLESKKLRDNKWTMVEMIDLSAVSSNLNAEEYDGNKLSLSIGSNIDSKREFQYHYNKNFAMDVEASRNLSVNYFE